MQGRDAESGGLAQDVARGLGPGQANQQDKRAQRWRGFAPDKGKGEMLGMDRDQCAFAPRAVEQAGIETIARSTAEHIEDMLRARIPPGQGKVDF